MPAPLRRFLVLFLALAAAGSLWFWKTRPAPAQGATGRTPSLEMAGASRTAPTAEERDRIASPSPRAIAAAKPTEADAIERFNAWTARYLAAPAAERSASVPEGLRLAEARRAGMAALISADPKRALDSAAPMAVRQALPAEIVARLEERVNAKAFYGVLGVAPDPQAPGPPIRREVLLDDGTRYEAHVFGARLALPTTENASVSGIVIDKVLALDERRVRVLESGERPDPRKPIFNTCPISGKTVAVEPAADGAPPPIDAAAPAIEFGGEIHYLCDGGHIRAIEEELVAAEGASGGPLKPTGSIASTRSTGVRTLLYMRLAFPETRIEPQTEAAAYEMMRQVNDFMVEGSYGAIYLLTTVTPLIVLPHTEAWYNGGGGNEFTVRSDAQAAARELGYDTGQYDLDIVAYRGGPGGFNGLAYVGGKGVWLRTFSVGVAAHELGHNFGLWHANFWNTGGQSVIGSGSNSEYGNVFDTMGAAGAGDQHFNANHKSQIDWLPAQSFVTSITASGIHRVLAFDQPRLDPGSRYALRIQKDGQREYWAEFRQKSFGGNASIRDGILLNWAPWGNSAGGAQLLDTTPGSPDDRNDAALTIGRTFSDFESGIHITPIGKGGAAPESMDVVVNLGTFPGNQTPLVSVSADALEVAPNTPVNFTASASDPDGDALSYAWDFGDRTFSSTNSPAVSHAWISGEYTVRCLVSDMKGQVASDSVVIRAGAPGSFRVSGQVTLGGLPLAGVRVSNGAGGSGYRGAFTDSDGTYTIAGLNAGSHTLTAALDGYSFAPAFANPLSIGPSVTNADFTATETPRVTLTVTDSDCSEAGANPGAFRIARTGSTASALTVNCFSPRGTAALGDDYSLAPALAAASPYYTATIPAGQAALDLVLTPVNDTAAEGPETVTLELAPGGGYVPGGAESATIVIEDDDTSLPVVSLRVTDADARESGAAAAFLVSRTGPAANPLVVRFSVSGTASAGSDYTSIGTQVTIPAGAASAPVVITPIDDSKAEGSETVTVTLSNNAAYIVTANTQERTGTINLLDDDIATLTVTAADDAASEAASDTATFVVTRTGSTAAPLTVNYAIGGSAAHGVDFARLPGVLTIPAGSSVGSVTIVPADDALGEPQQTVTLQLRGSPAYAVGDPGSAMVNLADNDDPPVVTVGVSDGTAGEPSSSGRFRFTTTGSGSGSIVIRYTVSGTATPGSDYAAISGTLSMGRNTTAEVTITPIDDTEPEDFESVTVTIDPDPAYTTFLADTATIHIVDDDQSAVSISTTGSSLSEGGGVGRFWVSRTGATTGALTVSYAVSGTATNSVDYTLLPGTITIPPGQSGAGIDIVAIDDSLKEGTETVVLTLAPGPYGIGIGSATYYLADNDAPSVQVKFSTSTGSGSEGAGTVNVPVVLTAAAAVPVTVEVVIGGGSATGGVDYRVAPNVLAFAPGEISKGIPLTILDDAIDEPNETVVLRLRNANGAALGTSTHTFTINDNDDPPAATVAFAATSAGGLESISPAGIVVSLSAVQAAPVSVDYAVIGGSAASGADYTLAAGTLVFAPGETAKIVPNAIIDGSELEPDETIVLALSNASGASLGANATHTYTIVNDDAPAVTIAATDPVANEAGGDTGLFTLTRTGATGAALTANLTIAGNATAGVDYQTIPDTVVFAANSATATIAVAPIDDTEGEGDETVIVSVAPGAGYSAGSPDSATVTIVDDEPAVSIAATDPDAAEEGLDPGEFTLTRTGGLAADLAVNVAIGGTAANGADYQALAPPVVIPAGSASVTRTITPIDDSVSEGPETVMVSIEPGPYLIAAPGSAIVTIADDDFNLAPVVTLQRPASTEIAIPGGVGLILNATVSDDGRPLAPGAVTTAWTQVSGPGAVTFGDAAARNTTAKFSANGACVLRLTASDGALETTLDLAVNVGPVTSGPQNLGPLVNAGGGAATTFPGPATLAGSISDDGRPLPANLTSAWQSVSGPGEAVFADAGAAATTVTFPAPGAYLLRLIADDGEIATFDEATVTTDAPTVTVAATDDTATEFGTTTGTFTITRTGGTAAALVVHFTASGSAAGGEDYDAVGDEVTIPSGAASADVIVRPIADAIAEGDETVTLTIEADSNYMQGSSGTATITLADEPMDDWRFANFGASANDPPISGDLANPDDDALENLLERALASDPWSNDAGAIPVPGLEGGGMTLTYRRPASADDLIYAVEAWTVAGGWEPAPFTEEILSDDGTTRSVKSITPKNGARAMIIRLRVTRAP